MFKEELILARNIKETVAYHLGRMGVISCDLEFDPIPANIIIIESKEQGDSTRIHD